MPPELPTVTAIDLSRESVERTRADKEIGSRYKFGDTRVPESGKKGGEQKEKERERERERKR
ncbi:hypothetical protein X777_00013 [Ooceraea biroi]|uniref:Uncharacterized protein n=1 Tax=Ooceraea biroi TaxID=2015173 RepID=A0A026VUS8_OOCBI|nr:hypothetical protein X777_00013 [Ooceraea biroi]